MKVRVSDDELATLRRRAGRAGVSPQRYVLGAVEAAAVSVPERRARVATFGAFSRQLVHLSAHVAQLATEAQATGRVPAGTTEALADVERLAGPLGRAAERLAEAFEKPPAGR